MNRVMGIDHGRARIGVAVSDELAFLAQPLCTLDARDEDAAIAEIVRLGREKQVARIVVGLPRNMDGSRGPAAEAAEAFAGKIREAADCPVTLWDERLTTVAAERSLREAGRNARNSRAVVDQVAAQILLQSWLDAQSGGLPPCG